MATLNVHEAMGSKVDREAVATLVLPQLWAMSMGPCTCEVSKDAIDLTDIHSTERRPIHKVHVVSDQHRSLSSNRAHVY